MLAAIYRKVIPYSFRKFLYELFVGKIVFFFRNYKIITKSKFIFLFSFLLPKTEKNKAYAFIGRYGFTAYPLKYTLDYKDKKFIVEYDNELKLPYVIHNGKKLYFPDFYTVDKTSTDYLALLIEQDERAAHRYVRSYDELKNKTLLDIGSAEGIFALDTIEITKDVIIFECEEYWLKPLRATFAPWQHKVTFVEKYVGDKTEGRFVTIDEFLKDHPKTDLFLKMDIEGAERRALKGAEETLSKGRNIQMAICTYHQKNDPEYMADLVTKHGFTYEFSNGFMCWGQRLSKGLIRCIKE